MRGCDLVRMHRDSGAKMTLCRAGQKFESLPYLTVTEIKQDGAIGGVKKQVAFMNVSMNNPVSMHLSQ